MREKRRAHPPPPSARSFHGWRFSASGAVTLVPAAADPCKAPPLGRALRTFPAEDYCGMAMAYFHADAAAGAPPEFELPSAVRDQARRGKREKGKCCARFKTPSVPLPQVSKEGWTLFKRVDLGPLPLSPIDWVEQVGFWWTMGGEKKGARLEQVGSMGGKGGYDARGEGRRRGKEATLPAAAQAPDFSHFHELHSLPLIPWTTRGLPAWLQRLLPIRIGHSLSLFFGDSEEWAAAAPAFVSPRSGLPLGITGRPYMIFTGACVGCRGGGSGQHAHAPPPLPPQTT